MLAERFKSLSWRSKMFLSFIFKFTFFLDRQCSSAAISRRIRYCGSRKMLGGKMMIQHNLIISGLKAQFRFWDDSALLAGKFIKIQTFHRIIWNGGKFRFSVMPVFVGRLINKKCFYQLVLDRWFWTGFRLIWAELHFDMDADPLIWLAC